MQNLFITGAGRSGTTLVEKLLHNHPKVSIASQPFPYLYIYLKNQYYKNNGTIRKYPLSNYLLEGKDILLSFYDFLNDYELSYDELSNIMKEMTTYSGQLTKEINQSSFKKILEKETFRSVYLKLNQLIADIYSKSDLAVSGSKEVYTEEYMPYILQNIPNSKGIIIIRDPRDVIASLNYGQHQKYTGKIKPVLFNIRNWRKSVAFLIYLSKFNNFIFIKYEDLIQNLWSTLNKISNFLRVEEFSESLFQNGIKDQSGFHWNGNSSFDSKSFIDSSSIGRYKKLLPMDVIKYIETTCYPEMEFLNYKFTSIDGFDEKNIISFKETYEVKQDFANDYSYINENILIETQRIAKLKEKLDEFEAKKWFIFNEVYNVFNES